MSLFINKPKSARDLNFRISRVLGPDNELFARYNSLSIVKFPIVDGMIPENMMPTSSMFVNLFNFPMNVGIKPVSLFFYKEIKTRDLSSPTS